VFYISSDKSLLQKERILELLNQTYWAKDRTMEQMETAVANSVCFGAYCTDTNRQIGLVRVVTDFVTAFYLCDVIVDPEFRGQGVGKELVHKATSDGRYAHLRGLLVTSDAHGLYAQYGFTQANERHMGREPNHIK